MRDDWWNDPPMSPTERLRVYGISAPSAGSILLGPDYDVIKHYERLNALREQYPLKTTTAQEKFTAKIAELAFKDTNTPPVPIQIAIRKAIHALFEDGGFYDPYLLKPSSPDDHPQWLRDHFADREELYSKWGDLCDELDDFLMPFLSVFVKNLPHAAFTESKAPFTLSFVEQMPYAVDFIEIIIEKFVENAGKSPYRSHVFRKLAHTFLENVYRESGTTYENLKPTTHLILPSEAAAEHRYSPTDVVRAYLKDTPLAEIFIMQLPFELPEEQRFSGHWLLGPPNTGKTNALLNLFLVDVPKKASIIVMDSKGEFLNTVKDLQCIADRLVLIEPSADAPIALNPLNMPRSGPVETISLIEYIMSALLESKFTGLQSTLFRHLIPAIFQTHERPTLDTFRLVVSKGIETTDIPKLEPHLQTFFLDREAGFYSDTYRTTKRELIWRLDSFKTHPIMRTMFSAPYTKLDLGALMDEGKIIVINNSKELLSEEGSEFFSRIFISLILSAAQRRSRRRPEDKLPCYVYIDECHTAIRRDAKIATILDECRSQKIALILAHQRVAHLADFVLDAVANCAIRMGNVDEDARTMADKLRISVDELRSLPVGCFATYIRGKTTSALKLQFPYIDPDTLPKINDAQRAEIRARVLELSFTQETNEPPKTMGGSRQFAPAPAKADDSPNALQEHSDQPPRKEGLKRDDTTTKSSNDPHTGDHAKPADRWGDE